MSLISDKKQRMDEQGEQLIILEPESEKLRKFISYYYFHFNQNVGQQKKFKFFPNTINALTIYSNSRNNYSGTYSLSTPTEDKQINYYYGGIRQQYSLVELHSPFDKVAVAFKPLAINSFIQKPLLEILSKTEDLTFNYFKDYHAMNLVMQQVFGSKNFDEKVELLDAYFLNLMNDFSEPILERALGHIHNPDNLKLSVMDLANLVGVTQKTLTRKFKIHLNCTPKKYSEIHQFRSAFEAFMLDEKNKKMIELVYEFDYSDQSNFIHQFNKITGLNPKKLFKKIKRQGDGPLYWKELE